jgi:colanic acid biosynthesis glycosyl transferase WcaI
MVNRRLWFRGGPKPVRPLFGQVRSASPRAASLGLDEDVEPRAHVSGSSDERSPTVIRRLLFVNQYYWPDQASTAQHLADLAESLAARGFECHVLCAQGRHQSGEPAPPAHEVHEGVHIHRVPATSLGRRTTLTRMADYLSFYARAVLMAAWLPRFDAAVTLTTPPLIGLIGTLLRRLRGTPHLYWSMDLHPDASLALRRMSPRNPLVRALAWLSNHVYRQADRVIVLGPYMGDRVRMKGVRQDRLVSIPVWSRRDQVYPVEREVNPLRRSLGLDGKFVAMYSGNLGLAHSFDEFLEAARRLRDRDDMVFLFVGAGPRAEEVRSARDREGLTNVRLLDYVPRQELHHSLSVGDVHLISMRPEMTGIVVPGKLYGIMAAGRPALFVGPAHCESADTIRRAGCGFTIAPGDAEGVVSALTTLAGDLNLARQMGQKGRLNFLATHERNLCCYQWFEVIRNLISRPSTVAAAAPTPALGAMSVPAGSLGPATRSWRPSRNPDFDS